MPTTPTGSRVISSSIPGLVDGSFSPDSLKHSPAKKPNTCEARTTSPMPSERTFPSSRESSVPRLFPTGEQFDTDALQDFGPDADVRSRPACRCQSCRFDCRIHLHSIGACEFTNNVVRIRRVYVSGDRNAIHPLAGYKILLHIDTNILLRGNSARSFVGSIISSFRPHALH